jgi:hypothetical protein
MLYRAIFSVTIEAAQVEIEFEASSLAKAQKMAEEELADTLANGVQLALTRKAKRAGFCRPDCTCGEDGAVISPDAVYEVKEESAA